MNHIAVIWPRFIDAILRGEKTVECRLTRVRCPPFGRIAPGDTVYIKERGGPMRAAATASRVEMFHGLTPDAVDDIRRRFSNGVNASDEFWSLKRGTARWGTLIWLDDLRTISRGPPHPPFHGRGWMCLGPSHTAPLEGSPRG